MRDGDRYIDRPLWTWEELVEMQSIPSRSGRLARARVFLARVEQERLDRDAADRRCKQGVGSPALDIRDGVHDHAGDVLD